MHLVPPPTEAAAQRPGQPQPGLLTLSQRHHGQQPYVCQHHSPPAFPRMVLSPRAQAVSWSPPCLQCCPLSPVTLQQQDGAGDCSSTSDSRAGAAGTQHPPPKSHPRGHPGWSPLRHLAQPPTPISCTPSAHTAHICTPQPAGHAPSGSMQPSRPGEIPHIPLPPGHRRAEEQGGFWGRGGIIAPGPELYGLRSPVCGQDGSGNGSSQPEKTGPEQSHRDRARTHRVLEVQHRKSTADGA